MNLRSTIFSNRRIHALIGIAVLAMCGWAALRVLPPKPSAEIQRPGVLRTSLPSGTQEYSAALAEAIKNGYSEADTLKACLYGSADVLAEKRILVEPVKAVFIDGQTKPVDMILCVTTLGKSFWYRLDRTSPNSGNALIKVEDYHDVEMRASPDGKYLAVQRSAEGHPWIEIVDLPKFLSAGDYQNLSKDLGSYPGYVSIRSWNGSRLEVTSNVLLSHPKNGIDYIDLLAPEVFSWDFANGKVEPLRDALRDLVPYYAEGLKATVASNRREAVFSLRQLEAPSAIPLLERMMVTETDPQVRTEITEALAGLRRAAATQKAIDSMPARIRAAAAHYRQYHDLASLEIVAGGLRRGMPRTEVEALLGEPDWPVTDLHGNYYSDQNRGGSTITLTAEYLDRNKTTARLESFEIGPIGE